MKRSFTRRDVLVAGGALSLAASPLGARAEGGSRMNTRKIPRSSESLPVIGLGTWQTFDVGGSSGERAPLRQVLQAFFGSGAKVIDSSPMYGRAEEVVGDLVREERLRPRAFIATKVWTTGKDRGIEQMRDSMRKMAAGERIDLMQVHNLQDWRTHLDTLRAWKAEGRVRYIGVTHYARSAFDGLEQILRKEKVDFIQLPYSIASRDAEARLLPAAEETGTAVLVMRPFESGELFTQTRGKPIPDFARELGIESWAQYFLKFILGHAAVTCPIPATANPRHLEDNLRAGSGRYPEDAGLRKKMVQHLGL
jgi:diketogulonate reductase-like aldo/keto reductase